MLWTVVVPVKPPAAGKSRLRATAALAQAIALDTVQAAAEAGSVGEVVVVTADRGFSVAAGRIPGVRVVLEARPAGIAAAIAAGLAGVAGPRAALLGDLPALRPVDLDAALALAAAHERAFVPDAEGDGTTLVTALGELVSAFGPGSAAAHERLGLHRLELDSTVRRDVDSPEQLAAARALGLGPRSREL